MIKRVLEKEEAKRKKIAAMEIDYEFPGFASEIEKNDKQKEREGIKAGKKKGKKMAVRA